MVILSQEEFIKTLTFKTLFYGHVVRCYSMFFSKLVDKTPKFSEQGKREIREAFSELGCQVYYRENPKVLKIYLTTEFPLTEEVRPIQVFEIPVFVEHGKFYFKKSGQYMMKNQSTFKNKHRIYKEIIMSLASGNTSYYDSYKLTAERYDSFIERIECNSIFSTFEGMYT